jgi:hypothetical protein
MNKCYVSISSIPTEKAIEQDILYICAECLNKEEAEQNKNFLVSEWLEKVNKQKKYIKPSSLVFIAILEAEGELELTR